MKKVVFFLFVILWDVNSVAQNERISQDSMEVNFAIAIPKENSLTSIQRTEIKNKLEQILARTQSSGVMNETPFVIVPEVKIKAADMTAGAKETFTVIEGEMTLIVKNRYDGTAYNEIVIPLKEMVEVSHTGDPKLILIQKINPKDRRFVRFVRTTQERIAKQYSGKVIDIL